MQKEQVLNILYKFKLVDKHQSFHEILPSVIFTSEEEKEIVANILDVCCTALIKHIEATKKPSKMVMKKIMIECMDAISIAPINAENREFGYQLGWYLSEKVMVSLNKGTEKKIWGYWQIEANEVQPPKRPRISGKRKTKKKDTPQNEITSLL